MSEHSLIYGLVLIGGESRRMGRDKAGLIYHEGQSQAEWTYHLLRQVCETAFLSVRAGQGMAPGMAGVPVIPDADLGIRGPMAGILSAMRAHPEVAWLVLSCDLPQLELSVLEFLIANRRADLAATAFKSNFDGLPEPLCAIYEPSIRPTLEAAAAEGRSCPRKLLIQGATHLLDLPVANALDNINTPEEYRGVASPTESPISIRLLYYAMLSSQRGLPEETISTTARTPREVYAELVKLHHFTLTPDHLRVAINEEFALWDTPLQEGDELVFLPPMSGG